MRCQLLIRSDAALPIQSAHNDTELSHTLVTLVPVSNTIAGMVMIPAASGSESVKEATKQDSYSNCQINDIKYNGRQRETH